MIFFERAILHLDLDAFFVEAELLAKPELRGKPVIVGGGERGVVASCSYEARAKGVRSAMPVAQALRLCPEAAVLSGTRGLYARLSRQVTEIIADSVPLFEKASIDEFYADLSGMERHFGCWAVAQGLRRRIQSETGLPISICLAANKTTAKIGVSEAKPNGELCVYPGEEKAFLAPLPVSRIPSVGGKTEQILLRRGIRTIGQLADADPSALCDWLGVQGQALWAKANGAYDSPVVPWREAKSISNERTFDADIADEGELRDRLLGLCGRLGFALREQGRLCANVSVKIRYSDFSVCMRQRALSEPTQSDSVLWESARQLFEELWQAPRAVRLLGVRLGDLRSGAAAPDLFGAVEREGKLLQKLDAIRRKHGFESVIRAAALHKKSPK